MNSSIQPRPSLPATRVMLFIAGLLVLAVGFSLFVLTDQTARYFAWTVGSLLTAAFLGASYWTAAVLEFLSSRERVWVNARPSIPAVTIFTFLTLLITIQHRANFHFDAPLLITRAGTWFWLAVYLAVPLILTVLWVRQTRAPGIDPPRSYPLPRLARLILLGLTAVALLLGLGLLIAPLQTAPFWPWPLTALTGRAIGAWLIGIAVAAGQALWEADRRRVRAVMISFAVFALLQFVALARLGGEMAWDSPAAWLYVAALLLMGGAGLFVSWGTRHLTH